MSRTIDFTKSSQFPTLAVVNPVITVSIPAEIVPQVADILRDGAYTSTAITSDEAAKIFELVEQLKGRNYA